MAFTLDDRPALDVEAQASPRWQRFAGGRRLAHVGYGRRIIRAALGTLGASLLGALIVFGDDASLNLTRSGAWGMAQAFSHDVKLTSTNVSHAVLSTWEEFAGWARTPTPSRRPQGEASSAVKGSLPSPTSAAQPTATREASPTTMPEATTTTSASTGATPTTAPRANPASTEPAAPSPTVGTRQSVGTPISVVTTTPAPTAPNTRPTATIPRPASTPVRPVDPLSYQVVAGDTIWGIAARFGSTVDAIIRANRLQDADSIVPGARLVIPR